MKTNRKRLECACGSHHHTMAFDVTDEEGFPRMVDIYLTTHRDMYSFWQRVKVAWSVLRGNSDHVLDGFLLEEGDNLEDFVDIACSLVSNGNTR